MPSTPSDRCRIVLIAPLDFAANDFAPRLAAALKGGDVASVILPQGSLDEDAFQAAAAPLVTIVQETGAAAVIAGSTRVADRLGADGVHLEVRKTELAEAIGRVGSRMAVGTGGAKTRDDALDLGEERPDYIFFGRFGYDDKPEPHPRNLSLGRWWAEMIALPCIVAAGSDIATVATVATTGADFVALSAAVFGDGLDPTAQVAEANRLLDEGPHFGDALKEYESPEDDLPEDGREEEDA